METTVSFGYWIRRQRKALDLTQQALAGQVGCSLAAIKKIERDERRPSRQIAERMADILGVPASQREIFIECARGLRPVDQLSLAHEPAVPTPTQQSPLPTGTVTFLYTDIEGSTKLWEQYPQAMAVAHARHNEILREAIESNNGYVFQLIGDAFGAAFHTAGDAVRAAVESQVDLQTENWGETPIHVRMSIHTGKAEVQQDGLYSGFITLSHIQRLIFIGHGGQVLLSSTTHDLVHDELPEGVDLRDMGLRQLKDWSHPEHIFQLVIPGLRADFPPLKILESFPHNLPVQLTSFVGREREMAEMKQLLSNTRLLTLTGPGGTGKTRLALQLAAEVLKEFSDGVWFVELAPVADPTLMTQTIASTLGVREQPRRSILDALMDYLRSKNMLLILDNCEHLIETCAQLADSLLRAVPHLKILASSREALDITGETVYRVPSLPLPDLLAASLDALSQNDCVRLFVDRASAAYPHFRLKEKNAPAITVICRRLDGIPLAIELAAARTKVFPPDQIAAGLDDRFRLLTSGNRAALPRHQTLRALIDWSYDLLSKGEHMLLRRLSVFAGGWSFEAAQAVCGEGVDAEILDLLTHLVDKSLVVVEEQTEAEEGRYRLLETIRQYAHDKLFESGEEAPLRDRHLEFFLRFAEETESKLRGADQSEWLDSVETEHDNLRAALAWSLESGGSQSALRLAGALYYFWELRGYWSEGQKWLEDALALSEREQSGRVPVEDTSNSSRAEAAWRAKALYSIARLRFSTRIEPELSLTIVEESLRLWRELEDKWWMAVTLEHVGLMLILEGDIQMARTRLEEGVSLAREIEDRWPLALCLIRLASPLMRMDVAAARQVLEEGVKLVRRVGDKSVLSQGLNALASTYLLEGDLIAAARVAEEALLEIRATGSIIYVLLLLLVLVIIRCLQGNPANAKGYCFELLALARETGASTAHLLVLAAFGVVAIFSGQPGRGVRLLTATESLGSQRGIKLNVWGGPLLKVYKQVLEMAQAQLDPAAFEAALHDGGALTSEQALALATENESEDSQLPRAGLGLSSD